MSALPSGLPEHVADEEELSRFLTQSNQYSSTGPKAAALLPNPKHRNASVFRGDDIPLLRQRFETARTDGRQAKAVAIIRTAVVREVGLDVTAAEPPPAHANIVNWPWFEADPEFQKARQLELAGRLAGDSRLVRC